MLEIKLKLLSFFKKFKSFKKGFSLVELSVVVIIISILLYSMMSGNNIMKNAKVVSLMKETELYMTATKQFIDTYNYLPGDFPSAKLVFCKDSNPNCTENGDGNGYIGSDGSGPLDSESLNFFRHLYLAGLINREFVGTSKGAVSMSTLSSKHYPFPKSSTNVFLYVTSDSANGAYNRLNRIAYGSLLSSNKNDYRGIPGWLAKQYDCKMDDCSPTTGSIIASNLNVGNGNNNSSEYSYYNEYPNSNFNLNISSIFLNNSYAYKPANNNCIVNTNYNIDSTSCLLYKNIYNDDSNFFSGFSNSSGSGGTSGSTTRIPCTNSNARHNYAEFPTEGTTDSGARLSGNCITGFEQDGNPFAFCNNGTWSMNVKCRPKKCLNEDIHVDNGIISSLYGETTNYDETRIIECETGYKKNSDAVIATCNRDGSWSYNGTCEAMTCDNSLINVQNGTPTTSTGTTKYNNELTITCNTGYTKDHTKFKIRCNEIGEWDYNNESCNIVECNSSSLDKTTYVFNSLLESSYVFGTEINYSCNNGYTNSNGTMKAICSADTTWVYTSPCDSLTCDKAELNSTYFSNRTGTVESGTTIDGSCNKGYYGTITAECKLNTSTGQTSWDYNNNCSIKNCNISNLLDTNLFGDSAQYNQTVITCTNETCSETSGSSISLNESNYYNYGTYVKLNSCITGYSIYNSYDKIFKCDSSNDSTAPAQWVLVSGDKYCGLDGNTNDECNSPNSIGVISWESLTVANNESTIGTCSDEYKGSVTATCNNGSWEYTGSCKRFCDLNDLRSDPNDNTNEVVAISAKAPGVPGSKFRENFFLKDYNFTSNIKSGEVYDKRYFTSGTVLDATCYNNDIHGHYTEISLNGQITISEFGGLHAYKCVDGEWKRGGNCVPNCQNSDLSCSGVIFDTTTGMTVYNGTQEGSCNNGSRPGIVIARCELDNENTSEYLASKWSYTNCMSNCLNSDLAYSGVTFEVMTGLTKYNNIQIGNNNETGPYGPVMATCQSDGTWNYERVCDKYDLRDDDNSEFFAISEKSPGVPGSKFYKSFDNMTVNTSLYGGQIHNERYFTDGVLIEASCDTDAGYTEITTDGQVEFNWGKHAYKCENGIWKRRGNCALDCQNSSLAYSDVVFSTTTGVTKYKNTQIGIDETGPYGPIIATCQLDGTWNYERVCDKYDLREGETEFITTSIKSPGVPGSKFYRSFNDIVTNTSLYGGKIYDKRYFTDGVLIEANCDNGYTEVTTGGQVDFDWGKHAYKCENGIWKRRGNCVLNSADCQNSDLAYPNTIFSTTTGTTASDGIQAGIDETGTYGAIIAICKKDISWEYLIVCDVDDLRGEGENVAISDKSPGVPGSKFRQNYNSSHTNGKVYGNNRYFTNGAMMDATCYNDDQHGHYKEIKTTEGPQLTNGFRPHAYVCENGEWKRAGSCAPSCGNSTLSYPNTTFNTTTGFTEYSKTQKGTCNSGYTGTITATCQVDGWHYSGICIDENVCDKNDLSLVANSYLSQSNEDSQPLSGTLYANGALLDASCNSGYVESADNGDIQGTWKSHAYKCVDGQWKTMGSCAPVNCSSEQIIQEMENNHMVLECVNNSCWFVECNAGYSQVGNWVGYSCSNGNWVKSGSIQCTINNNFCDINDIYAKLGETMNLTRNGTQYVINGSIYNNSSYVDGTMIDAYCNDPYNYTEMETGGEIPNEWSEYLLSFKCVNGEWKRMGNCIPNCENSSLSYPNTTFSKTTGTTKCNETQTGTCGNGYSGTITAKCEIDNENTDGYLRSKWTYSGSCE